MTDNEKSKNLQQIQVQILGKYLSRVRHEDILSLSMKIYPVIATQ